MLTILEEDSQAFLDEQIGIEDNQSVRERKDIITGAHFEELSDGILVMISTYERIHRLGKLTH